MDFTVVNLDQAHHCYFRKQFALHAEGGRILGRLLGDVDLGKGRAWAVVPATRAAQAAADLESDPIRTEEERRELAGVTARRLASMLDAGRVLTFEYWTATSLDGTSRTRQFLIGDSVFDYVTEADPSDVIEQLLLSSQWFPGVGVIGPIPDGVDLESSRGWSADQIDQLVAHVELVLVAAWDADGYVFWEPLRQDALLG
jgi:hypothetical protein